MWVILQCKSQFSQIEWAKLKKFLVDRKVESEIEEDLVTIQLVKGTVMCIYQNGNTLWVGESTDKPAIGDRNKIALYEEDGENALFEFQVLATGDDLESLEKVKWREKEE